MPARFLFVPLGAVCVLVQLAFPAPPPAVPSGGVYQAGSGTISTSDNIVTINQQSLRGVIDWTNFSIGKGATVSFQNGSGATLNRVTGEEMSGISGSLSATGSVYLINPQGILIGQGARINTNGDFLASTLSVSNDAFMKGGSLLFQGTAETSVVNLGAIDSSMGSVFLIGREVRNGGRIGAANGTAGLAAGSAVLLSDTTTDQRIFVKSKGGEITNTGSIAAAQAELKSKGGNIYALAGHSGVIAATGTAKIDGQVWLIADGGTTTVTGTIAAKNANGAGGMIETSGERLALSGATVQTGRGGNWLIDPVDLTVDASAATTIANSLATANVTLMTTASGASGPGMQASGSGDINVNAVISWTANTALTLDAYHGVTVNAPITASGATAGLVVKTNDGGSGGYFTANAPVSLANTASLNINSQPYTLIASASGLQGIGTTGNYALSSDIDLTAFTFTPLASYSGLFEGLGHRIFGLNLNKPSNGYIAIFQTIAAPGAVENVKVAGTIAANNRAGLLAAVNNSTIYNVSTSGSILGSFYIGGVAGINSGSVINSSSTATVSTSGQGQAMGGLVGYNTGPLSNSFATGAITAGNTSSFIGGLTGYSAGTISNSYATGAVTSGASTGYIGGLAGWCPNPITQSYATGNILTGAGSGNVGGLVGYGSGALTASFATGSVTAGTGSSAVGGLVGASYNILSSSYATGSVNAPGGDKVGGLVGTHPGGTIQASYSTGSVIGGTNTGGLLGLNNGAVSSSYWDITTSGQSTSAGGIGLTTAQWLTQGPAATHAANWDFSNVWVAGYPYPVLKAFPYVVGNVSASGNRIYRGTDPTFALTSAVDQNGQNAMGLLSGSFVPVMAPSATGVGTYGIGGSGQSAANHQLTYNGSLIIDPATLNVAGNTIAANKVYNGNAAASVTGGTLSGVLGGDTVTLSQPGIFSDKNVGNGKTVTYTNVLGGASANNYVLASITGTLTADITPLTISVAGSTTAANKVYDGAITASVTGGTLNGAISGDAVTLNQSGAFSDKNVGNGKAVTYTNVLEGASANNYALASTSGTLTADITPLTISIAGNTTAANKVYDGAITASVTGGTLNGAISGDAVTLNQSGAFSDKNVGSGKTVTYSNRLEGADANNYLIASTPRTTTANITPASLSATYSIADKTYDGTTAATALLGTLKGVIGSDSVAMTGGATYAFTDKNAGAGKSGIVAGVSLAGSDAANYLLILTESDTAAIHPAALYYVADAATRQFGVIDQGYSGTVTGLVGGDRLASVAAGTPVFTSQASPASTVGNYAMFGSGLTLTGPNYSLAQAPGNLTALTISPFTANINNVTRQAGAPNPSFGLSYSSAPSDYLKALLSQIKFVSNAPTGETPGVYQITPLLPSGLANDFLIQPGTLTIESDVNSLPASVSLPAAAQTALLQNALILPPVLGNPEGLLPSDATAFFRIAIAPSPAWSVGGQTGTHSRVRLAETSPVSGVSESKLLYRFVRTK